MFTKLEWQIIRMALSYTKSNIDDAKEAFDNDDADNDFFNEKNINNLSERIESILNYLD